MSPITFIPAKCDGCGCFALVYEHTIGTLHKDTDGWLRKTDCHGTWQPQLKGPGNGLEKRRKRPERPRMGI